jgi:addiction module RelB/DinJ family antitoxin
MRAQDVRVTIMIDRKLKQDAEALFDYLGLSMSDSVNMLLRKAVDQKGIPFPINADSQWVGRINTDEITSLFNTAVKQDVEKKQKKGLPVARYDSVSKQTYLENADGTREYV